MRIYRANGVESVLKDLPLCEFVREDQFARRNDAEITCLNIERFTLDPRKVAKEMVEYNYRLVGQEVKRRARELAQIMRQHRLAKPDRLFGFYSYVPLRDYWAHAQGDDRWDEWRQSC